MTYQEIKEVVNGLSKDELFKKSRALHADYQGEQYDDGEALLNGQTSRTEVIDNKELLVIYNFEDGYLHSNKDDKGNLRPAIEYPAHWEYWDKGIITKVRDSNTVEMWENCKPISIQEIE